jgi:serine/threonine protein kinase
MKRRNSSKKFKQSGGYNRPKSKRLSLKELDSKNVKLTKINKKAKYPNSPSSKTNLRNSVKKHNQNNKTAEHRENERIVEIVERLFEKFKIFKNKVRYEDDGDEIKEEFQMEMCKDNLFNVKKTICGVGSYKVVLLCNQDLADCKYVYAFDFKHHPKEPGDEKFMKGGRYSELYKYNDILSIAPIFHKKLYCGYDDLQRVDFMLFPNNGNELFNMLYIDKLHTKFKSGSTHNLWLAFVFISTALYSFGLMHQLGYVHRDLKPENMLVGNKNNEARDFLTITDYGFVVNEKEERYDVTGTPEYLTPKISRIYKNMESSRNLKFVDLVEHDLHSIGYNLVQILISEVFSSISSKSVCKNIIQKCGNNSVKMKGKKCKVDAMTYISCTNDIDGTLGEKDKLMSLKHKHKSEKKEDKFNFPDYGLEIMKKYAINLSSFGFNKHLKDNDEGKRYAMDTFNRFVREIKMNKDYKVIKKNINNPKLKVKLNPIIWNAMQKL